MVSASSRWLIDTITPRFIQVEMTLLTGTSIRLARSLAVTNSVILSILLSAASRSAFSISRWCISSRFSFAELHALLHRFVGEACESFLHLLLNVFAADVGLYGTFVAFLAAVASSCALTLLVAAVVGTLVLFAGVSPESRLLCGLLDVDFLLTYTFAFLTVGIAGGASALRFAFLCGDVCSG